MDYAGKARSNYFRVVDRGRFVADLARHGLPAGPDTNNTVQIIDGGDDDPRGSIMLLPHWQDGGWPVLEAEMCAIDAGEAGIACPEYEPTRAGGHDPACDVCRMPASAHDAGATPYAADMAELVSRHLVEGDVAILSEVGSEGWRYLYGQAVAINSAGRRARIDLGDIVALARNLGQTATMPVG